MSPTSGLSAATQLTSDADRLQSSTPGKFSVS